MIAIVNCLAVVAQRSWPLTLALETVPRNDIICSYFLVVFSAVQNVCHYDVASMSQVKKLHQFNRGLRRAIFGAGFLCAIISAPTCAFAAAKSFFFATRQACAASGNFNANECENAFANAQAEVLGRAPTFFVKFECQLRFSICARLISTSPENAAAVRFGPEMLGVEISGPRNAEVTAPVLAVATPPGLFQSHPISRIEVTPGRDLVVHRGQIFPAGHFEPFNSFKVVGGWAPFPSENEISDQSIASQSHDVADLSDESRAAARRERLKNAPFVE